MKTVNFVKDLPKVQQYIDKRSRAQTKVGEPIVAIEFGMKLCQSGHLILNFDVREEHERDGEWTLALDGPTLKVPRWSSAYMNAGDHGVEFVMLSGKTKRLAAGADDRVVAGVFGQTLLAILRDAKARGVFQPLPLTRECQVEVLEFDWMWEWPADEDQLGDTNLYHKFRPAKLLESPGKNA